MKVKWVFSVIHRVPLSTSPLYVNERLGRGQVAKGTTPEVGVGDRVGESHLRELTTSWEGRGAGDLLNHQWPEI